MSETLLSKSSGKVILTGNEAIVRGALEAGVKVVSSYPGGPVTQILENMAKISKKLGIYTEWSTNEKVALEVGIGASLAGQRALVSFKDVGLNAAYDTFMALSRGGCRGGLVIVVGHDGQASVNMQDCRYSAEMANLMAFDPADSQEAKEMTFSSFNTSELLELPVIIIPSSHICHGKGEVVLGEISQKPRGSVFVRVESKKYISVGPTAPERVEWLKSKSIMMEEIMQKLRFNSFSQINSDFGIIVAGHLYHLATRVLEELNLEDTLSTLKISSVYPFPTDLVSKFCSSMKKVLVLEELEPFIEDKVSAIIGNSVEVKGKSTGDIPTSGLRKIGFEMIKTLIADFVDIHISRESKKEKKDVAFTLCPGCLHKNALYAARDAVKELGETDWVITGDQGCSLLLSLEPEKIIDTEYHMGSSIGVACGLVKGGLKTPIIAAIGDSAFFHNGVSALVNAIYNDADITILILDNSITAMTGLNPNPSSGVRADGSKTKVILIEDIARGCGAEFVTVVDPRNTQETVEAIKKAIKFRGPAVVVIRGPCIKAVEVS